MNKVILEQKKPKKNYYVDFYLLTLIGMSYKSKKNTHL